MKHLFSIQKDISSIKLFMIVAFVVLSGMLFSQPANDNPCNATPLVVDTVCNPITDSNISATSAIGIPPPACGFYSGADVWYSAIVPSTGSLHIITGPGTIGDGMMAIYSGSCQALSLIACNDDFLGLMPAITATGLTPGDTLYIMMCGFAGQTGTFTICATEPQGTTTTAFNGACNDSISCANPNCIGIVSTLVQCTGVPSLGGGGIYGCLGSTHNPIWNVFQTTVSTPITIGVNSLDSIGGHPDVDYIMWGPFATSADWCAGITDSNIISCNYSTTGLNSFTFTPVSGNYYVLLSSNYSNLSGVTVSYPVSPAGSITCDSVFNFRAHNAGPTCEHSPLHLMASTITGATNYQWTGPNAFSATGQNVTIASPDTLFSGTYTAVAVMGSNTFPASTWATVKPLPTVTLNLLGIDTLFLNAGIEIWQVVYH